MNGIGVPITVIAIGLFNVLLAVARKARWYGSGSLLMMLGGVLLIVGDWVRHASKLPLYIAAFTLVGAMACLVVSLVKRELRVTMQ